MTSEGDILDALIALMRKKWSEGYHFYTKENVEGFVRPCFFVDCHLVNEEPRGANTVRKEVSCVIDFFQKERNQEDTVDFVNSLRTIFLSCGKNSRRLILKVGKRYILVEGFAFGYVGQSNNIPEVTFSLNYFDSYATKDTTDIMRNLDFDLQLGGNE